MKIETEIRAKLIDRLSDFERRYRKTPSRLFISKQDEKALCAAPRCEWGVETVEAIRNKGVRVALPAIFGVPVIYGGSKTLFT